jgi:hypothetical protein
MDAASAGNVLGEKILVHEADYLLAFQQSAAQADIEVARELCAT